MAVSEWAFPRWALGGHCGSEEKTGQRDQWQEGQPQRWGSPRDRTQTPEGWLLTAVSHSFPGSGNFL